MINVQHAPTPNPPIEVTVSLTFDQQDLESWARDYVLCGNISEAFAELLIDAEELYGKVERLSS